jgi:hypothetical protein
MDAPDPIAVTRRWIQEMVIGLNLCPFARKVFDADRIRFVVSDAVDEIKLLESLSVELRTLTSAPRSSIETTILIHPHVLADFRDYNEFLAIADQRVEEWGFRGIIQIASFHPDYQFADTRADEIENYTNRSPYPMLHLLREESITEVAGDEAALLEIPERNVQTLRKLGIHAIRGKLEALRNPPSRSGERP